MRGSFLDVIYDFDVLSVGTPLLHPTYRCPNTQRATFSYDSRSPPCLWLITESALATPTTVYTGVSADTVSLPPSDSPLRLLTRFDRSRFDIGAPPRFSVQRRSNLLCLRKSREAYRAFVLNLISAF